MVKLERLFDEDKRYEWGSTLVSVYVRDNGNYAPYLANLFYLHPMIWNMVFPRQKIPDNTRYNITYFLITFCRPVCHISSTVTNLTFRFNDCIDHLRSLTSEVLFDGINFF